MADNQGPRLAIHVDAVRLLIPYISRERLHLSGVHFEPHSTKGVLAIATDGHKMGVAYDRDAVVEACPPDLIVAVDGVSHALKPDFLSKTARYYVVVEGDTISVRTAGSAEEALNSPDRRAACSDSLIDAQFVDWRRVVRGYPAGSYVPAVFNAEYVEAVAKSYADVSGMRPCAAQISCRARDEPALLRFSGESESLVEFFAILMPMRGDEGLDRLPDWFAHGEAEAT